MAVFGRDFSLLQWNARGIRNKLRTLKTKPFVQADILVLQETFLNPGDNFFSSKQSYLQA
jgi:exonuclease III